MLILFFIFAIAFSFEFKCKAEISDKSKQLMKRGAPRGLSVPSAFDVREQWPSCAYAVVNQGQCGSCWAFGSTDALSWRFCIHKNELKPPHRLSVEEVVECNLDGLEGCTGGDPATSYIYASEFGVVSKECLPYISGNGKVPTCPDSCTNSSATWKKHFADIDTLTWLDGAQGMQEEMMANGPIVACFDVYEDFMHWNQTQGPYVHRSGALLGGHCVTVVGWNHTAEGKPYFTAQNSWNSKWGMNGYFWIEFGQCGFEDESFSILPK